MGAERIVVRTAALQMLLQGASVRIAGTAQQHADCDIQWGLRVCMSSQEPRHAQACQAAANDDDAVVAGGALRAARLGHLEASTAANGLLGDVQYDDTALLRRSGRAGRRERRCERRSKSHKVKISLANRSAVSASLSEFQTGPGNAAAVARCTGTLCECACTASRCNQSA